MKDFILTMRKAACLSLILAINFTLLPVTNGLAQSDGSKQPVADTYFDTADDAPRQNKSMEILLDNRRSPYGRDIYDETGNAENFMDGTDPIAENAFPKPPQLENPYANVEQPYAPPIEIVGEGSRYTLGPGDVIQIMVRNQPDFSGMFVVGSDGNIQYNWAGDVQVMDMTKEQVKAIITERLTEFVRYPEVGIVISEYNSKAVYIMGAVRKPGKYPMKGDSITLRDALVSAGLPTDVSALKKSKIIRETADGPKEIKVNLKDLLFKGEMDKNFELQPGDIIFVPTSKFVKTTEAMSQAFGPLFQAAAVYSVAQDISGRRD